MAGNGTGESGPVTLAARGVDFPYRGYLTNVAHQLALRFKPAPSTGHDAKYIFLVRHDGSLKDFRFLERSGDFAFDLEAQRAAGQAAEVGAFGPLPEGFGEDVLPVVVTLRNARAAPTKSPAAEESCS